MNKGDLVKELEKRLGSRKVATEALESVLDIIIREVTKGGKVSITGFGTFDRVERAARTGRNPRTGTSVRIPKSKAPRFRAGAAFKTYVKSPRQLPKSTPAAARAAAGTGGLAAQTAAKKATATKATAKKATAKKAATTKAAAKKAAPATKTAAKKVAKKAPAKRAAKR